jgi:hypothetical protein
MKRTLSAVAMICLVGWLVTLSAGGAQLERKREKGDEKQTDAAKERDRWMLLKLSSSHEVFEALTKGDLDDVARNGRRLLAANILEQWLRDAEFKNQSAYKGQLNAFEYSVKELVRHAEDKDVDGALDAYVGMTQACVRCHKLIRDVPEGR